MKRISLHVSLLMTMTAMGVAAASAPSRGQSVPLRAVPTTPCPEAITTTDRVYPVPAVRIAEAFCVEPQAIEELHLQGLGYGEISKAYVLAQATGLSVDELVGLHQAGEGWGQIAHDLGLKLMGGVPNARVVPWKQAGSPNPRPTPRP